MQIKSMEIKKELYAKIKNAVKKELEKETALLFSGGLDSTIIGKILVDLGSHVLPITVGFKNSEDMLIAQKVSKLLFKKHVSVYLTKEIVEETIPRVIEITKQNDIVTISVGCVVFNAAKYASMLGYKTIFTGTGGDEIFAGYASHEKALEKGWEAVHKECQIRLKNIKKDVERDTRLCEYFGLKVKAPFLDKEVIDLALKIHPSLKISKDEKKIILREIAKDIGVPEIVYLRKKKAAQYGSGVQKIIKKLAKENGFKTISEYLNNVYKK